MPILVATIRKAHKKIKVTETKRLQQKQNLFEIKTKITASKKHKQNKTHKNDI